MQPGAHPDQLSGAPWVEKFRPAGLGDLVAHEEIISIRTCAWQEHAVRVAKEGSVKGLHIHTYTPPHTRNAVNRLIDTNQLPHLLFYGPPGTGKTSTILACAKYAGLTEHGQQQQPPLTHLITVPGPTTGAAAAAAPPSHSTNHPFHHTATIRPTTITTTGRCTGPSTKP